MQKHEPGAVPPGFILLESKSTDRTELLFMLQQGVYIPLPETPVPGRVSVTSFLLRVLNLDDETFRDEIKTMMLNNMVVDNPDRTDLKRNDVLIVSGAMPGLVGAMLRSDSPIKVLRSTISGENLKESENSSLVGDESPAFIRLKAFNTVLRNHMDDILRYGVYIGIDDEQTT